MSGRPAVLHFVGPRKPWHWRYKGSSNEEFFRARGYDIRHIPELDRERSEVSRYKGV